jgi:DUF1365 family protein
MSPETRPGLYRGFVIHDRVRPARNRFKYGGYFVYLPVSAMGEAVEAARLISHNKGNLFSVWDRDHGPRDGSPLRPWIDDLLKQAGVDLEGGEVFLLTIPRVMGARFYPISLWYCYHADGTCRAILAEVHNTFRQHHNYLLHEHGAPMDWKSKPKVRKVFHVSPFIPLDAEYNFSFGEPGERLFVWIDDVVEGSHLLLAGMDLHRHELADGPLLRTFFRLGPMSIRALTLIHWQAVKLAWKRVGFYHTPDPPVEETTL